MDATKRSPVLITGIAGFCGSHLAEHLLSAGYPVAGLERAGVSTANLAGIRDRIDVYRADLLDPQAVRRVLAAARPGQIYHLAGLTKAPAGAESAWALYEVNVRGTMHLLEAALAEGLDAAVLVAGSSAQYGIVPPEETPIDEQQPFRPITHYGVSKAAQEMVACRYASAAGIRVVCTRAFNIIGPRQSPAFVAAAFARQVAEIEAGLRAPVVKVGNLAGERDFIDVRDVARAYRLALEEGEVGDAYNVCSGEARSIRSLLDGLLGMARVPGIEVRVDPARLQAADVPAQVGDYRKLERRTGWAPRVALEESLRDLLDDWRGRVAAAGGR
jgi:GDP-4-dehydro-6-deoxy-D-mannose reductase